MSKVELYAAIRQDSRTGVSNRGLERKYGVGWRTVRQAPAAAWPEPREKYPLRRSKLDPFKDAILLANLDAPRKQRQTATRIFDRLVDEHAMTNVSYQVVHTFVAVRRPEIRAEAGRGPIDAFVPQPHPVTVVVGVGNQQIDLPGRSEMSARMASPCRIIKGWDLGRPAVLGRPFTG